MFKTFFTKIIGDQRSLKRCITLLNYLKFPKKLPPPPQDTLIYDEILGIKNNVTSFFGVKIEGFSEVSTFAHFNAKESGQEVWLHLVYLVHGS